MSQDTRLIKPTLEAQLVDELLEGAKGKGVDEKIILANAGVNPEVLYNLNTRISLQIYYRILSAVREYLQDEMMGFLKHPIPPRAFPVYCEAATGYPDFLSLFRFANNFYGLFTDEFRWSLDKDSTGRLCSLSVDFKHGFENYKRFIIEFLMVTSYRSGSWLIGEHYPIQSVHFTFSKPDHIEKYHYLLSKRIYFNSDRNRLVFNSGVLTRPIIRNHKDVPAFLRSSIGWFLLNPDSYPFTRLVRQNLSTKDLSEGFPNFEQVSRSLNISHQHLWRKLNQEGTCYQKIKTQLRRDTAIHYLINTQNSIHEIAEMIGYTDDRPFYSMFTQWTGMAPGEYRRIFQTQQIKKAPVIKNDQDLTE
jgi:AraC-like DNA-binding protein